MGEVVLAQRDQDAVVGAREIEVLGGGLVLVEPLLERRGRAVLDEVGEVLEELLRTQPAAIVGLRQREDLLELVEDQERQQRAALGIPQQVAAVVQELPQRLALDRGARAAPVAGLGRGLEDRLLDLLGRRRRISRVVHPHVHRAEALAAQPRHEPGAQQRGLAEAGLPEQHGEVLALDATREFGGFLIAAVEVAARLLGVGRETQPRVLGIDRHRVGALQRRAAHERPPRASSCSRRTNSGLGSPPGRRVMCTARNFSGTSASASGVSSMHTGRMNTAPSAMLRERSTA